MLDNGETAESPLLTNIEILKVQVQNKNNATTGDNDVETGVLKDANGVVIAPLKSNIDAGDMKSVETYINDNSRADLTIEDVSHNSNITTLVMRETDMGDVDYNVFFDPENIIAAEASSAGAKLVIDVLNLLSAAKGENPVAGFSEISFNVGDKLVKVAISTATTYDQVLGAIRTQLTTDGITTVNVALEADSAVFNKALGGFAQGHKVDYSQIILTSTDSKVITEEKITLTDSKNAGDLYFGFSDAAGSSIESLTTTNVVFDRVGRDSKGGDFVAGSDSTGNSGSKGIQKFEVSVDRSSWLNEVSSTNNTLEVLNIKNITTNSATQDNQITAKDGKGNLRIDKLVDVRVVDAVNMTGKLNITAELTGAVVEKYLNLKDTDSNPANDNSEIAYNDVKSNDFYYNFGSNNDTLDLTISAANLAAAGTTTREDFVLEINGNGGNDTITTMIGDAGTAVGTEAWYLNSKINANMVINAGSGNDTINNFGGGDWKINLDSGNNTVYVDNSGKQGLTVGTTKSDTATWVVNTGTQATTNIKLSDLVSSANDSNELYKANMTVTFKGLTATAVIASTNYKSSDLQINNAIKAAIQNDAVLSKLIVATDGPANTLIITSLIDGAQVAGDLAFAITGPTTALTAAEVTALTAAWGASTLATHELDMTATGITITTTGGYNSVLAKDDAAADITGINSLNVNDSVITSGTGNDVIVLSTTGDATADAAFLYSDDVSQNVFSNNTIVFNAAFGNDTIVNFKADTDANVGEASAGYDVLDFTKFLTSKNDAVALDKVGTYAAVNSQITLITGTIANDTITEIKALYDANDQSTASTTFQQLLITTDAKNIGTVYSIVDGAADNDTAVTLLGTIDLADTAWSTLTVDNFASIA